MRKGQSAISDMFYSALAGGAKGFQRYLNYGGNKNIQSSEGQTVIMYSVLTNDTQIFDKCLELDVNLETKDSKDNTVLHLAAISPNIYFLTRLLTKQLELNSQNYQGNTPLMMSIINNCLNSTLMLLENGGDINQPNKDGNTAAHLLIKCNSSALLTNDNTLLSILQTKEICWSKENYLFSGRLTPLMYAINNKDIELVDTILNSFDPVYFSKDLLQLCINNNHCFKYILMLKGVNTCVEYNKTSTIKHILKYGTRNDINCIVQNYGMATSCKENDLLTFCCHSENQEICKELVQLLIDCGLMLSKMSPVVLSKEEFVSRDLLNSPVSLKAQSRTTLRYVLKDKIHEKIFQLPIPIMLKRYLLMFDQFACNYPYKVHKFYKKKILLK